MKTSDFEYDLPDRLIAQEPPPRRSDSRMMVLNREDQSIEHSGIKSLPDFLESGDLVVFNNTKVFPARTRGIREDTGGRVELLFVEELESEREETGRYSSRWLCIFGSGSKTRAGQRLSLCDGSIKATISAVLDQGHVEAEIVVQQPIMEVLERAGSVPLPPYIARAAGNEQRHDDIDRYQTVYASELGAVAAPTAGLHFTQQLLTDLEAKGVGTCEITLHVGPGTFLPVKIDDLEAHKMHSERFTVSESAATAINAAKERGGRVVAVGTTTVRTLEGLMAAEGQIRANTGKTDIFIYPPYNFSAVDALLTNFHLPRSTLLMMVSAFAGREFVLRSYREAVVEKYRFYSYGDCMLLL